MILVDRRAVRTGWYKSEVTKVDQRITGDRKRVIQRKDKIL